MFEILFAGTDTRASANVYEAAVAAKQEATRIFEETGKRVRINRIVEDDSWKTREATRLTSGQYRPLPDWWQEADWWKKSAFPSQHFTHMSQEEGRVAFTESPSKGMEDRQLVLEATKYLARFFKGILSDAQIMQFGMQLGGSDYKFNISADPEVFERIYTGNNVKNESSGSISCMAPSKERFHTPRHPAYVMGAGDLAVSWLSARDGDNNRALARCVVWPEKKIFVRIYSLEEKYRAMMEQALVSRGYRRSESFAGARLLKMEFVNRDLTSEKLHIMPYMDGKEAQTVTANNEGFFVIQRNNMRDIFEVDPATGKRIPYDDPRSTLADTISAAETCGYAMVREGFTCEFCEKLKPRRFRGSCYTDSRHASKLICSACRSTETFACAILNRSYLKKTVKSEQVVMSWNECYGEKQVLREHTVSELAFNDHTFFCQRTKKRFYSGAFNSRRVRISKSEAETWCSEVNAEAIDRFEGNIYSREYGKQVREEAREQARLLKEKQDAQLNARREQTRLAALQGEISANQDATTKDARFKKAAEEEASASEKRKWMYYEERPRVDGRRPIGYSDTYDDF